MAGKRAAKRMRRELAALALMTGTNLGQGPVGMSKKKRNRRRNRKNASRASGGFNNQPRQSNTAPVAVGLKNRQSRRTGVFAPVGMFTSDLLDTVQLGTTALSVVYSLSVAPQVLPRGSRAEVMSRLYAKYRPKKVTFRIDSAVPTSSGGQYAAFFDPNPSTDWQQASAVGALTSMPVKQVCAAWECATLNIPKAELERDTELYTYDSSVENLVTRFGQIVIITMAVPNTTPPGSATITVWMDVDWEFYEPNVQPYNPSNVFSIAAGNWSIASGGPVTTPAQTPTLINSTAFRVYPELPATLGTEATQYLAISGDGVLFAFDTEEHALTYSIDGGSVGKIMPGSAPSQNLPASVAIPIVAEFATAKSRCRGGYKAH
jgi:hypothetical protein